jgi:conjugal transfer pilus assembly protein TraB
MPEKVSLQTPDDIQKRQKTIGLAIILFIVICVAAIGSLTKGGAKVATPVTWIPGEEVNTKELELSNLRSELKGLHDKISSMDDDYKLRLESLQSESEARLEQRFKDLELLKKPDQSANTITKGTNILGEGVSNDTEFETYSLPTLDGKEVIEDVPINNSGVPLPPKVKRMSAADYNRSKSASSNQTATLNQIPDDFSIIDPTTEYSGSNFYTNDEVVAVKKSFVENPMAGFIPSTSSAPIVLFTGLDALASGAGRGNPEPVLFRIQDDAFLAGDARYRLSNCNGTAVGYGDLSTTRVKLQATRLVCVDLLENRLLEAEINGFITDSDGTLGMRGEVQNREGQIAGKALAASFAEGAAGILTAAGTTVSNANGVTQTTSALEGFSNGFASGTSNAAAMLAERYIEQMEAISPSITVEKGRRATLHFTEGMKLIWKEYQGAYIEKITPQI